MCIFGDDFNVVMPQAIVMSFAVSLQGYQVSVRSVVMAVTYSTCWSGSTATMNAPPDVAVTAP